MNVSCSHARLGIRFSEEGGGGHLGPKGGGVPVAAGDRALGVEGRQREVEEVPEVPLPSAPPRHTRVCGGPSFPSPLYQGKKKHNQNDSFGCPIKTEYRCKPKFW